MFNTRLDQAVRAGPNESPGGTGVTNRGSIRPDIAEPPLVLAGFGWFGLVEGISEWGLGVSCFVKKETDCSVFFFSDGLLVIVRLRCWIRFAVFLLTYMAPRRALQLAHDPTMFARSYGSPPWSSSVTWSAWLLGCRLHQWHTGSSWMTWARSSFHRLVVYIGLPLIVLEHRSRDTDAHAEKGTRRGCPRLT